MLTPDEKLLEVEARVLNAWIAFREGHDLEKAEMSCCDVSKEMFAALRAFEYHVRGANGAPQR